MNDPIDNLSAESPELKGAEGLPVPSEKSSKARTFSLKPVITMAVIALLAAGSFYFTPRILGYVSSNPNLPLIHHIVCKPKEVNPDRSDLAAQIGSYTKTQTGTFHVSLYELDSNDTLNMAENVPYVAASTIKVPILLTLYKQIELGKISKDEMLTVTAADKETGTGYFIGYPNGTKKTVAQTAEAMIKASDNTATRMILRRLGNGNFSAGRDAVQAFANSLGQTGTTLSTNYITTSDLALYLSKLYLHQTTTADLSEEMLTLLTQDQKMDASFATRLVAGVPAGVRVAHKIGSQTNAISDAGIIFLEKKNYILVVAVINGGWTEADAKIAAISKTVYSYETARDSALDQVCS